VDEAHRDFGGFKTDEGAAGLQHAPGLFQGAVAITDLHAERHRVEIDAVACHFSQVMRVEHPELHVGRSDRRGDIEHQRAEVGDDTASAMGRAEMLRDAQRDVAGADRHIEHGPPALGRDAPRHPPLPGPVNEEAEQVAQHVMARRDPGEDVVLDWNQKSAALASLAASLMVARSGSSLGLPAAVSTIACCRSRESLETSHPLGRPQAIRTTG